MSTRLSGVQIPVTLDTKQAEKQLDQLESKLAKDDKTAKDVNRTLSMNNLLDSGKANQKKAGTTGSGGGEGSQSGFSRTYKAAGSVIAKTAENKVASLAQGNQAGGLIAKLGAALGLPEAALKAGLAYGVTSFAAKAVTPVITAVAAAGGNPASAGAILDQLDQLRSTVQYIESYVKTLVTGAGDTHEVAEAEAYITGKIPNLGVVYNYQRKSALYEDQLNKRLGNFKTDALAGAVGRSMSEIFKDGMNR